ncbi:MAG TPA: hypothetical protein VGZ00_12430 [Candidatus Baltobacteraceae bacterium]|nr:hypothetical protein [Candidatus Baltobacteraceae bacterium]
MNMDIERFIADVNALHENPTKQSFRGILGPLKEFDTPTNLLETTDESLLRLYAALLTLGGHVNLLEEEWRLRAPGDILRVIGRVSLSYKHDYRRSDYALFRKYQEQLQTEELHSFLEGIPEKMRDAPVAEQMSILDDLDEHLPGDFRENDFYEKLRERLQERFFDCVRNEGGGQEEIDRARDIRELCRHLYYLNDNDRLEAFVHLITEVGEMPNEGSQKMALASSFFSINDLPSEARLDGCARYFNVVEKIADDDCLYEMLKNLLYDGGSLFPNDDASRLIISRSLPLIERIEDPQTRRKGLNYLAVLSETPELEKPLWKAFSSAFKDADRSEDEKQRATSLRKAAERILILSTPQQEKAFRRVLRASREIKNDEDRVPVLLDLACGSQYIEYGFEERDLVLDDLRKVRNEEQLGKAIETIARWGEFAWWSDPVDIHLKLRNMASDIKDSQILIGTLFALAAHPPTEADERDAARIHLKSLSSRISDHQVRTRLHKILDRPRENQRDEPSLRRSSM